MNAKSVLEQLEAAKNPEEQAAIIANSVISKFQDNIEVVARRCALLPWFNSEVVDSLVKAENMVPEPVIFEAITQLPFVEETRWGYTYHELTRAGLVSMYGAMYPEEMIRACEIAAPAFLKDWDNDEFALAAVYCLFASGRIDEAVERYGLLIARLESDNNWLGIDAVFEVFADLSKASSLALDDVLSSKSREVRVAAMTLLLLQQRKDLLDYIHKVKGVPLQDAEDVLMIIWETALNRMASAIVASGDSGHLRRWLFSVAKVEIQKFYYKERDRPLAIGIDPVEPAKVTDPLYGTALTEESRNGWGPSFTEGSTSRELDIALNNALKSLPKRQRQIVILRYFQGADFQAIASILDITQQTARVLHRRAIRQLRSQEVFKDRMD